MKQQIATLFAGSALALALISQTSLGSMYANGDGVPQDYLLAAAWYRKAADQGYDYAQIGLAWMYYQGHGVPQDYVAAHMWFNLATTLAKDRVARGLAVLGRDEAAANMTHDQINEAQRMAREWKPKK